MVEATMSRKSMTFGKAAARWLSPRLRYSLWHQPLLHPRRRIAAVASGACLAATIVGASFNALGQDQSAATPNDVVFARKTIMAVIANNMYEIDSMLGTGKVDLAKGRANADSISAMLLAFPHLFPPTTNTWTPNAPRDPAVDTFADPGIWTSYAFFYNESQAASKYAYGASRAENDEEFKKFAVQLRLTCDTCHSAYQKNN
jgi:cytochrome c556